MSRACVIIPHVNEPTLARAKACVFAEAQTAPTDCYVLEDEKRVGPATMRNIGIEWAKEHGHEFIMFLDADDEIASTKIEIQMRALDADSSLGWVWCNTAIIPRPGAPFVPASIRYAYKTRPRFDGYLFPDLMDANFIPMHAPLFRVSTLEEAGGFNPQAELEDWDLLTRVAAVRPTKYIDEVLAIYHKQPNGRNTRTIDPKMARRLFLNLGCGSPTERSWHPLPGFINLDRWTTGWTWEGGLPNFKDESVSAITVSHSLYAVEEKHWPFIMKEFYRVLMPFGRLRITEDDTENTTDPRRKNGWRGSEPFKTLTSARLVIKHMRAAGLDAGEVPPDATSFLGAEVSLIQEFHGKPPDVFHVEGGK